MPDLKIVELKPSKEADNNVEVIRLLEEALQYRQLFGGSEDVRLPTY